MTSIKCPIPGCPYETPESSETVACALLAAHSPVHTTLAQSGNLSRGPKLNRPTVDVGISQEQWNIFVRRWDAFTSGSGLDPSACSAQLFQCAGQSLGDSLLKADPSIVSKPTHDLMQAMKSLAVIACTNASGAR